MTAACKLAVLRQVVTIGMGTTMTWQNGRKLSDVNFVLEQ